MNLIGENLRNLLDDIKELTKAKELLNEIWLECGPYNNEFSDKIRYKLQDYFNFNDDE